MNSSASALSCWNVTVSTNSLVRILAGTRDAVARGALRLHLAANALTVLGMLLSLGAGVLLATGRWGAAALAMTLAGLADILDGAVARLSRSETRFGAFLDSTLDRISDMALYGGLAVHYGSTGNCTYMTLCLIGLSAAVTISYARARAENVIDQCRGGFWQRGERLVLLLGGVLRGRPSTVVWMLAVLPWATVIHRIWHTQRMVRDPDRPLRARWRPLGDLLIWQHPRGSVAYVIMAGACLALGLWVEIPGTDWLSVWFG